MQPYCVCLYVLIDPCAPSCMSYKSTHHYANPHRQCTYNITQHTCACIHVGMIDDVDSIDDTLTKSTEIVKRMYRKVKTDSVLWVMAFLILICIIIIVAKESKKD